MDIKGRKNPTDRQLLFTEIDQFLGNYPRYSFPVFQYLPESPEIIGKVEDGYGIDRMAYHDIVVRLREDRCLSIETKEKVKSRPFLTNYFSALSVADRKKYDILWSDSFLETIAKAFKVDKDDLRAIATQNMPVSQEGMKTPEAQDELLRAINAYLCDIEKGRINGWIDNIRDSHGVAEVNSKEPSEIIVPRNENKIVYGIFSSKSWDKQPMQIYGTYQTEEAATEEMGRLKECDKEYLGPLQPKNALLGRYMVPLTLAEWTQLKSLPSESIAEYIKSHATQTCSTYINRVEDQLALHRDLVNLLPIAVETGYPQPLIMTFDYKSNKIDFVESESAEIVKVHTYDIDIDRSASENIDRAIMSVDEKYGKQQGTGLKR